MSGKILIIDDDIDTLKLVGMMLQKQGYQIIASPNGEHGLIQAEIEDPDLIILDVMMPALDGYEVARRLRNNKRTADTPILMFTAKTQLDDKVTGFESGADDYLTKPTHPTELSAHVKALLSRSSKGRPPIEPAMDERRAFLIGVLASHGGKGTTTVAVNLGESLRLNFEKDVTVAELHPGVGTLGPEMGDDNPSGLNEILSGTLSDVTRQKVQEIIITHKTGLHFLPGSVRPKDGLHPVSPEMMETLVNRMSYLTSYLILDLGSGLNPLNSKLIPICNELLVLVEPTVNTLIASKAMISDLAELSGNPKIIHYISVNRIRSDTQIPFAQMEEFFGKPPLSAITPAPELFFAATNARTPAVFLNPDSLTAQQFSKLASLLLAFEEKKKSAYKL